MCILYKYLNITKDTDNSIFFFLNFKLFYKNLFKKVYLNYFNYLQYCCKKIIYIYYFSLSNSI